ncbi:MAG TPA: sulfatase-like hydrolase/transferase [Planctomycetota bacterium]
MARRLLGAACGVVVGGLISAWWFPGATGLAYLPARVLALLPGLALIGLVAVLLGPAAGKRLRVAPDTLALWTPLLAGFGATAGAWLLPRVAGALQFALLPGCTIALFLVALPLLRRSGRSSSRGRAGILVAAVLLLVWRAQVDRTRVTPIPAALEPLPALASRSDLEGKPSILWISVDTLRADALAGELPTPGFDALRSRSLWSRYALAPNPGTLPSHMSMLTGRGVLEHGVQDNAGYLDAEVPTFAGFLAGAGWRTRGLVSNRVLRVESGIARGFESWTDLTGGGLTPLVAAKRVVERGLRGSWTGLLLPGPLDRQLLYRMAGLALPPESELGWTAGTAACDLAIRTLRELAAEPRPWFFFVHWMDPHVPYSAGGAETTAIAARLPERYRGAVPGGLAQVRRVAEDAAAGVPAANAAAAVLQELYLREVAAVDSNLQRLLAQVDALDRPVLVVLVADHGEHFGEHELMLHGNSLYAELLHVPFFLAGPGIEPGELPAGSARLEDLPRTLLALCGFLSAEFAAGADLRETPVARDHVAARFGELALTREGWKLIARVEGLGTAQARVEPLGLFELAEVGGERSDRSAEQPQRLAAMLEALLEHARRAVVADRAALDESDRAALSGIGYAEFERDR